MAKRLRDAPAARPGIPEQVTIDLSARGQAIAGSNEIVAYARGLATIETEADAQAAGKGLRRVRTAVRGIKALWKRAKDPVLGALADMRAEEQRDLAPWLEADRILAAPILAWQIEERQRAERVNRERLEAARQQAEARQKAQAEATRAAAAAAPTKTAAKALERQARAIESAPPMFVAPEPEEAPTIEGVSVPMTWVGDVTDLAALVRAVAAGQASLSLLKPDQQAIDAEARKFEAALSLPGVTPRQKPTLSARGV